MTYKITGSIFFVVAMYSWLSMKVDFFVSFIVSAIGAVITQELYEYLEKKFISKNNDMISQDMNIILTRAEEIKEQQKEEPVITLTKKLPAKKQKILVKFNVSDEVSPTTKKTRNKKTTVKKSSDKKTTTKKVDDKKSTTKKTDVKK